MISRYTRPAMGEVWSDQHKIVCWLAVEKEICEGWHRRGRIPAESMPAIRAATCDLSRMQEIEKTTDHDVIAFLRAMAESIGNDARFVHLGVTSSDVVDTALAMQARDAGQLLDEGMALVEEALARLATSHRDTITIGRTHGMHAEPTTFGHKSAAWYEEFRRQRRRLTQARHEIAVGKISGAVGTHAHIPASLEEEVCAALGLAVEPVSTQVVQRDRHAFFLSVLAGIAGSVEKVALEIRHLQRTEIGEAEEPFAEGNQGSSAMPHKRNPHESERLTGQARLLRAYAGTALENIALWHERDISHSSTERIIFPDACILLDYMLHLLADLTGNLIVYPERMQTNLESSGGLIYSQRVLLALVDAGLDRQEAYKIVQEHATAARNGGGTFSERLAADPEVAGLLGTEQLCALFDPASQLGQIEVAFQRTGLDQWLPKDNLASATQGVRR